MRSLTIHRSLALGALLAAFAPATGAEMVPATAANPILETPRAAAPEVPEREILRALEGDYDLTSTFWPAPEAEPEVVRLPARRRLALDGRVLEIKVGPSPEGFRGTGLLGYDDHRQRFWYTWVDTANTGVAVLYGTHGADGSGALSGETPTPYGYSPLRVEIRREGSTEIHDYFGPGESGGEHRWLELRYQPSRDQ